MDGWLAVRFDLPTRRNGDPGLPIRGILGEGLRHRHRARFRPPADATAVRRHEPARVPFYPRGGASHERRVAPRNSWTTAAH